MLSLKYQGSLIVTDNFRFLTLCNIIFNQLIFIENIFLLLSMRKSYNYQISVLLSSSSNYMRKLCLEKRFIFGLYTYLRQVELSVDRALYDS